MLYDAFNGDASISWVASKIAGELSSLLPTKDAQELYNVVSSALNTAISASGGVSWTTIGSAIVDVATIIATSVGVGKVAEIANVLWSSATLV